MLLDILKRTPPFSERVCINELYLNRSSIIILSITNKCLCTKNERDRTSY